MMAIVSPDGAPEHEDEHDVRPLDVEEARRLGAASEHSPEEKEMLNVFS